MKYPIQFFYLFTLLLIGCSHKGAKLEDYLYEREYTPPQEIGFQIISDSSFVGDSVEIAIPKSYQTKEPYIVLILKDSIAETHAIISGKYKIRNGRIRYGLDYTFENYENLEIGQLCLWDEEFVVHLGDAIKKRFFYNWSEDEGVFQYVPTDTDAEKYLILDASKMIEDGNAHLIFDYWEFLKTY